MIRTGNTQPPEEHPRKDSGLEHKQIHSENGTVHYWVSRTGKQEARTLVFTHGLTADHSMFEHQVAFFEDNFNILTWDVPLHGLSRPYAHFSYKNTAVELKAILNAEGFEKVVLIGMSMGGYPSQMFGHLYPQRVLGLVGIDTTPFGLQYYSKSDLWWLKKVEPLANWIPDRWLRNSMARSVSRTDYSHQKMVQMLDSSSKAQIVKQMGIAYGQFAAENMDMAFPFPVLILLGEYDQTGKVKQYCHAWAKATGYPLRIIKDAAHFSNGDNPDQVNAEITAFVQSL